MSKPEITSVKTLTLPSGKTAEIRKLNGRELRLALRAADMSDSYDVMYAKIAAATKIDGSQLIKEDLDEMIEDDVLALMEASTNMGNSQESGPKK